MGPDKEPITGEYYIELSDGKRTKISGIQIFDFEDLKDNKKCTINFRDSYSFSINISSKYHMSQKKFKKWLMGRGVSRNDADYLCFSVGLFKGSISYKQIYLSQLFNPRVTFTDIIKEIWTYEGVAK